MRTTLTLGLLLGLALPLAAQQGTQAPPRDTVTVVEMRSRIEQAFVARAKEEMGLSEEQTTKLVATERKMTERRRIIERETRRLNGVLAEQLRPGIAAKDDVVKSSLDSLGTLRVGFAQIFRDEQRELATFLTPVQRAQFYRMRERMMDRVAEVRGERGDRGTQAPRHRP